MPSESVPVLLKLLRERTAAAHAQIEAQIDIPAMCHDVERYRHLLERFLGIYEPLEASLRQLPGWELAGFSWAEREKTPWLRADLRALGMREAEIEGLARCERYPQPESLAGGFGCAYVLEGSTLGGRQITGILAGSAIPAEAGHFFRSYGGQVGERWKEFCAMLGGDCWDDDKRGAAVESAVETFRDMGAWLAAGR